MWQGEAGVSRTLVQVRIMGHTQVGLERIRAGAGLGQGQSKGWDGARDREGLELVWV